MRLGFDLDIDGWEAFESRATGRDLEKVLQGALKMVGNQVKKEAYRNFSNLKTKHGRQHHRRGKGWRRQKGSIGDGLYTKGGGSERLKLVTVRVLRKARVPTISVHLYGNFKGKFFELGTEPRWGQRRAKIRAGVPKGSSRGSIIGGAYLGRAVAGFDGRTAKALDDALRKRINVWLKKQ